MLYDVSNTKLKCLSLAADHLCSGLVRIDLFDWLEIVHVHIFLQFLVIEKA
jgi:hypothetical protein